MVLGTCSRLSVAVSSHVRTFVSPSDPTKDRKVVWCGIRGKPSGSRLTFKSYITSRWWGLEKSQEQQLDKQNMNMIRNLIVAIASAMAFTVTSNAQVAPGTPVPLGGYLQDSAGNLYQVVLQKVTPAAPVAAAPVAAAPVVVQQPAQPQVVYVQQPAAAPQGNAVGNYVGKTLKTGVAGGAQGAVLGAITGRNVGKEALGMAGGAAAGQVTTDIIGGLFGK